MSIPRWTGRPLNLRSWTLHPHWFRILGLAGLTAFAAVSLMAPEAPSRRAEESSELEAEKEEATRQSFYLDILDVADLLAGRGQARRFHEPEGLSPSNAPLRGLIRVRESEEARLYDAEILIEKIYQGLSPQAMDEPASLEVHRGQLIAYLTPADHQSLRSTLENLRRALGPCVMIEARFVAAREPNFKALLESEADSGEEIDEELRSTLGLRLTTNKTPGSGSRIFVCAVKDEASELARLERGVSRFVPLNGQTAEIEAVARRAYLSDYELSGAGVGAFVFEFSDPGIRLWEEGIKLSLTPHVKADGSLIIESSARFETWSENAPPTLIDTLEGFSFDPGSKSVLLGAWSSDGSLLIGVLLRARVID